MAINRSTIGTVDIGTALNSLGNSATAAAQSSVVTSGTSSNISDITAEATVTMNAAITASASTRVDVYVWGTNDSTTSFYPGGSVGGEAITGTAGSITLNAFGSVAIRYLMSILALGNSSIASNEASIVAALGYVPRRWGLVFVNQTGAALAASGHAAKYTETYYT